MSRYIESEPESDDESEASVPSENEEDRKFIDDGLEDSPDRSIYRHESEEEEDAQDEDAEDEDEDDKAMRQVRRMTSRLLHRHGKREKTALETQRYHCGFGVRRKKTEGEIQEGLMQIVESTDDAKPPTPKRPRNQRRLDAPLLANPRESMDLRTGREEDKARPLKPRTFQFIEEMKERDRKRRIQDNTNSLKKVLDKERTQVHRRLTAPTRRAVVKKKEVEPLKGMRDITSFFTRD